jgi:hypothetical protein
MSLSIREIWVQNFQVLKVGKLSYSLSVLEFETNFLIDNDKDSDNAAERK